VQFESLSGNTYLRPALLSVAHRPRSTMGLRISID
jgi:hypothetical protein